MKNVEDVYRLSPMQQGLLFHSLYAPQSGAYVEQVHWVLRGELDAQAFRRAWQRVVDRHPVLRTVFLWEGVREPHQAVRRQVELPWEEQDWQGLGEQEQQQRFTALRGEDRRRGFTLTVAPLMRFTLVRLAPERYRCLWSYHHLLLDGWSLPLCLQEVLLQYQALRRGEPLELGPARPYRDYIAWLVQQDRAEAERYWRGVVGSMSTPTPLWVDTLPMPRASGEPYATCLRRLPAALSERLLRLARQHQLTPSTLLLGAWALLLARYSGEQEVAFGNVLSSRPAMPGAQSMLGLFIQTQVVRPRVPPRARVVPWLQQLQAEQIAARRHSHVSLVELQGWSQVPRGQPLFHSLVAVDPSSGAEPSLPGQQSLPVEDFAWSDERTGYPLTFMGSPGPEVVLRVIYDTSRFEPATVERLVGHLHGLLEGMAEGPERRLGELPLATEAERHQVLVEWNDTSVEYPSEACVHELFHAQAARTPEAVALVSDEEGQLTYGELAERAHRLAQHLRALGVGPGSYVGLCLERSVDMVVAILGILGAGGAYVPLDPELPPARLGLLLEDARARVLVTRQALEERVPRRGEARVRVDGDRERIAAWPARPVGSGTRAGDPLYVIYTSGSTGIPKGVCIPHRGVVRLVMSCDYAELGPREVVLLMTPFTFDVSAFELWGSLLHGARLVVAPPRLPSPEELGPLLRRHGVTVLWLIAPLLDRVMAQCPEALDGVRQVLSGGDVLTPLRVAQRLERGGLLINGYGPTECSTFACCHVMREPIPVERTVPIGRPIANTEALVLDGNLQPVPPGVPGELYLGGPGLALGYLNRPEMTAERFVPHPYSREPGARLYRTGDLVRWLPGGVLEYFGRMDHQVKVRGMRIEPGEVEAALEAHPSVQEAVVVVRGEAASEKRLVAYVVPQPGQPLSTPELERSLRERLPAPLVPSAFVALESLPHTSSGKIDRKALPAPPERSSLASAEAAPPRDSVELLLTRLWEELLHVRPVGMNHNFFELGGHSLVGVSLMARIAQQLGRRLPVSVLYEHPTPERLAALLRSEHTSAPRSPLVPLQPQGSRRPLVLLHALGGSVLGYSALARHLAPDQPVYGLEAPGMDGSREPLTSVEALATVHVEALRRALPQGPYLLAGWSFGGLLALDMARQLAAQGQQVAQLVLVDSPPPSLWKEMELPPPDEASLLESFAVELGRATGRQVRVLVEELTPLPMEARLALLYERAVQAGALPAGPGVEALQSLFNVYHSHVQALQQYAPTHVHEGPLALALPEESALANASGWQPLVRQPLQLLRVPGNHHTLLEEPNVAVLASQLRRLLEGGA